MGQPFFFITLGRILAVLALVGLVCHVVPHPVVARSAGAPHQGLFLPAVAQSLAVLAWYLALVGQYRRYPGTTSAPHDRPLRILLGLSALAAALTLALLVRLPFRMNGLARSSGYFLDELIPSLGDHLWIGFFMTLLFGVFLVQAQRHRGIPERQQRYALFAGFAMVPTTDMAITWQLGDRIGGGTTTLLGLALLLILTGSVVWYDHRTLGRITRTARLCFVAFWGTYVLAAVIAATEAGDWVEEVFR